MCGCKCCRQGAHCCACPLILLLIFVELLPGPACKNAGVWVPGKHKLVDFNIWGSLQHRLTSQNGQCRYMDLQHAKTTAVWPDLKVLHFLLKVSTIVRAQACARWTNLTCVVETPILWDPDSDLLLSIHVAVLLISLDDDDDEDEDDVDVYGQGDRRCSLHVCFCWCYWRGVRIVSCP